MLQSKMPNNQYVLSLDSLDLNFLRLYVQTPTEEKKPLYSRQFMDGNPTYYQVQLMSEELRDEDYCLGDYEIYLCHICNMEVPQTCYNKHVMSNTHQNHMKLAEKVLENVTKQIKVNVNIASHEEKQSYYCETCSKLVSMKHQRQHNLSNNHLKFIEKGKLTQNFVEMYIESTDVDQNSYTTKPSDRTFLKLNTISNSNYQYEDDSENEKECEKSKSIAPVIPINHIPDNNACVLNLFKSDDVFISTSSISNEQFQSEEETIINFQSYLKEMITKYKLNFKLPIMENTYVVINTPKGYKELITIDSFHGYKKFEAFVFCQLCQMWIEQNMKQHSSTELHVRNVTQPVKDNFTRAVINNQTALLNKHLTHCLLCNVVIQGTSKHEHSNPSHKKYSETNALQHTEISSTSKITYCDVCHIYHIDSGNLSHIEGKIHQKNLKANTTSSESNRTLNAIEKHNIPTNSASNVSLVETNTKETYCEICNRYIHTHNFKAHVKAKKHKDNLKKINIPDTDTTKVNAIPEPQQPQQTLKNVSIKLNYCEICNVPVPNGGMSIHNLGKPHTKNILLASKLNAVNAMNTSDQNKLVTTSVSVPQELAVVKIKRKRIRPKKKETEGLE